MSNKRVLFSLQAGMKGQDQSPLWHHITIIILVLVQTYLKEKKADDGFFSLQVRNILAKHI